MRMTLPGLPGRRELQGKLDMYGTQYKEDSQPELIFFFFFFLCIFIILKGVSPRIKLLFLIYLFVLLRGKKI